MHKRYDYLFPENGLVSYKHGSYHSTQVCHFSWYPPSLVRSLCPKHEQRSKDGNSIDILGIAMEMWEISEATETGEYQFFWGGGSTPGNPPSSWQFSGNYKHAKYSEGNACHMLDQVQITYSKLTSIQYVNHIKSHYACHYRGFPIPLFSLRSRENI